jgi:hypothetical protein
MSCAFPVFIHVCIHTGSLEGVTLLEVEPVQGEVPQEVQQEEPEGEGPAADLPECPDHRPVPFSKASPEHYKCPMSLQNFNLNPS